MNCPRCNTVVTQQDKYCPGCGLPLEASRQGGPAKKPIKKDYEEASTQLVDVDEFRKYMAEEKAKAAAAPAASPAPTSGPNLAGPVDLAKGGASAATNLAAAPASDPATQSGETLPAVRGAGRQRALLLVLAVIIVGIALVAVRILMK